MNKTYDYVFDLLKPVDFVETTHPAVTTCEEADKYTPVPEAGLKSILLLGKKTKSFVLCVLAGNSRLDFKAVQDYMGEKISMAKAEQVRERLECDPGSVPPLLSSEWFESKFTTVLDIDPKLMEQANWYFNPGVNTKTFGVPSHKLLEIMIEQGAKLLKVSE